MAHTQATPTDAPVGASNPVTTGHALPIPDSSAPAAVNQKPPAQCDGTTLGDTVCPQMRIPALGMAHPGGSIKVDFRSLDILTPEAISKQLAEQRAGIEKDVTANIDSFLVTTNQNFAPRIWRAINCFSDPHEGFQALKDYMRNPDEAVLRDTVRNSHIPLSKCLSLIASSKIEDQRARGRGPLGAFASVVKTLAGTFILSLFNPKIRGDLSFMKTVVLERLTNVYRAGEGEHGSLLTKALAPHVKVATGELLGSFDTLKERALKRTPLLDEDLVRSTRDTIVKDSVALFDRLVAQSFDDKRHNGRSIDQFPMRPIPEGIKFGVEFEGFVPSNEHFISLMLKVTHLMEALDLPASWSIVPKADQKYTGWLVTYDGSVKNPLRFLGQEDGESKVASLGLEIVSPILQGATGQTQLESQLKIMRLINMRTNESTGLHVHVDLKSAPLEQLKNLGRALVRNEGKLNGLIDSERRHGKNPFCKSIPEGSLSKIERAQTIEEFVEAMNPRKDRNMMFDFSGLVVPDAPPTIQYRGEGGANCGAHAEKYVSLLVRFTKAALTEPDIDLDSLKG